RRQLLLHRHAAALLADRLALQPRGLPGERIPLELLRPGRRERGLEPRDDRRVSRGVPRGRGVDLQDRLSAQELNRKLLTNGSSVFNLSVKCNPTASAPPLPPSPIPRGARSSHASPRAKPRS